MTDEKIRSPFLFCIMRIIGNANIAIILISLIVNSVIDAKRIENSQRGKSVVKNISLILMIGNVKDVGISIMQEEISVIVVRNRKLKFLDGKLNNKKDYNIIFIWAVCLLIQMLMMLER